MTNDEKALIAHEQWNGKIETALKCELNTRADLAIAYTPGVAAPCLKIKDNTEDVYRYTMKGNLIAVVSDGSAVLGLGNIGAEAGLPVMEGKCALFKRFADVDAVPIMIRTQDPDEIVNVVKNIAPTFGGINLEDISAPRCFYVEQRLKDELDIPVFHDDQHGTAIVVLAALINAAKVVKKEVSSLRVVINGAGSAGTAICKLLLAYGISDIIMCDIAGIIYEGMEYADASKEELAKLTNRTKKQGTLKEALVGADVMIGVSAPNLLKAEDIARMNEGSIVFAMANPTPEIFPEEAKKGGAAVVGTGRSDYPNQINNVLAFPGIFKGALSCRCRAITEKMKLAAADALASLVEEPTSEQIIPDPLDPRVAERVAAYVAAAANE